jgi:hypothetical protein
MRAAFSTSYIQQTNKKRETRLTVPTVHELRSGCLRWRRDIKHFLVWIGLRGRFNADARREVFSKKEICDVTTGYYRGLEGGDYGVEGVDVVEASV